MIRLIINNRFFCATDRVDLQLLLKRSQNIVVLPHHFHSLFLPLQLNFVSSLILNAYSFAERIILLRAIVELIVGFL